MQLKHPNSHRLLDHMANLGKASTEELRPLNDTLSILVPHSPLESRSAGQSLLLGNRLIINSSITN